MSNKEAELMRFVQSAIQYYGTHEKHLGDSRKNKAAEIKMTSIIARLRRGRAINKTIVRRMRARAKEDWHRTCTDQFVSEEMFDMLREIVVGARSQILRTIENTFVDNDAEDVASERRVVDSVLINKPGLVLKWSFNSVALLLVHGNGECNHVYTFLKFPLISDKLLFETVEGGSKAKFPIKIQIHEDKKRLRDSRMPFVTLDPQIFNFVKFHAQFFQPLLLRKYGIQKGTANSEKLLIDARNGFPITSNNIHNIIVKLGTAIDPELHLKPMNLHSSYATIVIRRQVHREEIGVSEHFQALSEDEFCSMLSAVMNTSVTQIRTVYAPASHADYSAHVSRIMSICKSTPEIDGDF